MPAEFRFEQWESIEEAESALRALLPVGSPGSSIRRVMTEAGAACFDRPGGLFCEYSEPGGIVVSVDWNVSFGLDAGGRLQRFAVNRGLTGP